MVHLSRSSSTIAPETAERLVGAAGTFRRARLAYRDVASATNRVSLIAAVLPADVVTTHTLVCLKTRLRRDEQDYLCGVLNSYVANYLVRQVMTTHLGSTTVENLRVPKLPCDSALFVEIGCLAHRLSTESSAAGIARLQARAARAYDLRFEEFRHVLDTFPLVPENERRDALNEFARGG